MRVMGVDPGLTRCGVAVIDADQHRRITLHAVGVLRTPVDLDPAKRLLRIEEGLDEWVRTHRPDQLAVERAFAQHNLASVASTIQAAGLAMLVGARHGVPVSLRTPSEVKAAITGSGRADKKQVGFMVAKLLRLTEPPKPADAADAVALAICQLWRGEQTNPIMALAAQHQLAASKRSASAQAAILRRAR